MIEVIVVAEGQTEETFVRELLAPALAPLEIFLSPRLVPTGPHARGGALNEQRVLRYLRNTLRERGDTFITTFFDLYGLPTDFPGVRQSAAFVDPLQKATHIEAALAMAAVQAADCRPERFLPHVQPYEFEALLFADTDRLIGLDDRWRAAAAPLRAARAAAATPEHVNDGPQTHPSARLRAQLREPRFDKVLHGTAAARSIGLARLRDECRHFDAWLRRIEGLRPL
jgi:Domain of unknown function (DUF4276)